MRSIKGSVLLWIVILLTIFCLILVGISSYFYFSQPSFSQSRIVSESSQQVSVCTDSDGNEIYKKGSVSFNYDEEGDGGSLSDDWCEYNHPKTDKRVGLIREGLCEGNVFKKVLMTCGWGFVCRNGACIEGNEDIPVCSDTDNGKNINKRGWTTGHGGSGRDECWISYSEDKEPGGFSDSCGEESGTANNCYVYEHFCEDSDRIVDEIIKCANGCRNGACL
jgi:hypothetical protein